MADGLLDRLREREAEVEQRGRLLTERGMENFWGQPAFWNRPYEDVAYEFGAGPLGILSVGGVFAKTANMAKLKKAKSLLKKGASPEKIVKDTGWWKGPDGKWRFEISDHAADFSDEAYKKFRRKREGSETSLPELFRHTELEKAYPSTPEMVDPMAKQGYGDVAVIRGDRIGTGGSSSPGGFDRVELSTGMLHGKFDRPEMRRVLLHELQHSIQGKEGFARGGAPQEFIEIPLTKAERAKAAALKKKFESLPGGSPERIKLVNEYDAIVSPKTPYGQYRRLAGEVEAEAVARRADMTPAERLERPFWLDYSFPADQQIIKVYK